METPEGLQKFYAEYFRYDDTPLNIFVFARDERAARQHCANELANTPNLRKIELYTLVAQLEKKAPSP